MVVKLVVLKGKAKGREIPLPSTQFVIGRGSSCHLRPHSDLVSKIHCAIARQPGGMVVVRDLKSRNHTFLNDKPVRGTVRVNDGDVLSVGPLQFQFSILSDEFGSPIQSVREENLRWLLEEENSESNGLNSDAETAVIEVPPHTLEEKGNQEPIPVDNSITVGKYLREYYRTRKNGERTSLLEVSVDLQKKQLQFVDRLLNRLSHSHPQITRDEVVSMLIDTFVEMDLNLEQINSPGDLMRVLVQKIRA